MRRDKAFYSVRAQMRAIGVRRNLIYWLSGIGASIIISWFFATKYHEGRNYRSGHRLLWNDYAEIGSG